LNIYIVTCKISVVKWPQVADFALSQITGELSHIDLNRQNSSLRGNAIEISRA